MTANADVTIVMVDDNADEIFLTRKLVRRDGIINNFVSERKPERLFETLADLRRAGVDTRKIILLLDINMPRVDGFEVLKQVRASSAYRDVPVIMLSASDDVADMAQATALGANGYLVKPFSGEDFFSVLNNVPQVKHQLVPAAA